MDDLRPPDTRAGLVNQVRPEKWKNLYRNLVTITDWKLRFLRLNPSYLEADEQFARQHNWKPLTESNFLYAKYIGAPFYRAFEAEWGVPPGLSAADIDFDLLLNGPPHVARSGVFSASVPLAGPMSPTKVMFEPSVELEDDKRGHVIEVSIAGGFPSELVAGFALEHLRDQATEQYRGRARPRLPRGQEAAVLLEPHGDERLFVLLDLRASQNAIKAKVREIVRSNIDLLRVENDWSFFRAHRTKGLQFQLEVLRLRMANTGSPQRLPPIFRIAQDLRRGALWGRVSDYRVRDALIAGWKLARIPFYVSRRSPKSPRTFKPRRDAGGGNECAYCERELPMGSPPSCHGCGWPTPSHPDQLGRVIGLLGPEDTAEREARMEKLGRSRQTVRDLLREAQDDPRQIDRLIREPRWRGIARLNLS